MTDRRARSARVRPAAIVAGASAAALWLLVGLAGGALSWSASTSRYRVVTDLVLPPTVPFGTWSLPAPWNVLEPLLVVLLFGATVLSGVALLGGRSSWPTSSRVLRFGAAWMVVVLAAGLTAAVWSIGTAMVVPGPTGYVWALQDAVPTMLATAWFGVVWGWAPALLVLVGRPLGASRLPTLPVVSGALAVLLAVALVAVQPAIERDARIAAGGTPDGQPTAAPAPTERPGPPALVAPEPVTPGADWCATDDVQLSLSGVDGALGHRAMSVVLVNRASEPCVVDSFPDVAFAAEDGAAVPVPTEQGASYLGGAASPSPVVVAPGSSATAALEWGAGGTGEAVATFWLAPYAGADRMPLSADTDLAADATVTISAWAAPTGSAG